MLAQVKSEVILIIPIYPNMELAAAQTASIVAEIMNFEANHIDEIQFAIIETCINAFEHSNTKDGKVTVKFIMKDEALELKIADQGIGFRLDNVKSSKRVEGIQKRGWGLEIIRNMMDEVQIESGDKGTIITMIKKKVSSKMENTATA